MAYKKFYGTIFILLPFLLLQGCQENPQEDVVVNRTDGVLESAILESAGVNDSEGSAGNHETAPESYTDSFVNASGDVTVTVDAYIQACNDPMPVVRIAPHDITSQEVQNWAQVLFDGHTAYEPASQLSKSEIEEQVLFYRQLAADRDGLIAEYGSEADAQVMID